MRTSAKELAFGGVFAALGTAIFCHGGILPRAMYACPILASAGLLPVRERGSRPVTWCCYAAIAILGTLLDADRESALLFVFLGYYPLLKPQLDAIARRPLRLLCKLVIAVCAVGAEYAVLLFVLRLDALAAEFDGTAPVILWLTAAMGLVLFVLYDLILGRLAILFQKRFRRRP